MKKHILILFLLSIVTLSAFGQAGSLSQSVYRSRVNDSTTVNGAHASGYGDIYFNNQRAQPAWLWWDAATSTYRTFGSGSGGWVTTGVQTLTGPFGVESADSIGIASNDQVNIRSSVNQKFSGISTGDYTEIGGHHAFVGVYKDEEVVRAVYQSTSDAGGNAVTALQSFHGAGSSFGIYADTLVYRTEGNVKRFKIDPNGSWHLGTDPGTSGYVLQSNGAGAAPTWVAPSGGGGTPGGSDTNVQYNDGGSFGGETGFTYSEGTNTLTIDNVTNGSASALTDGSTITITGSKHTLTSTQATITWTLSQTGDFQTTDIILNATSTTWTFPAGALCKVEGSATGNNVAALSGVSGDHYIMSIYKNGTDYRVAISNFGQ